MSPADVPQDPPAVPPETSPVNEMPAGSIETTPDPQVAVAHVGDPGQPPAVYGAQPAEQPPEHDIGGADAPAAGNELPEPEEPPPEPEEPPPEEPPATP